MSTLDVPAIPSQQINIVQGTHGQLIAFLVLNVWPSHLGLPLLLGIVLFSKRVQRHLTFINFCVTFIIVGISSSLLLYAGKFEGPEPSKMLCLLQASLLYGMPAITSLSAFFLVLQMFFVIRAHYHGREYLDRDHAPRLWMMLALPYIAFFVFVLATAVVGARNPERLSRSRRFFYCSVDYFPLTTTLTAFSAAVLLCTLVFEVSIVVILFKQWKTQKESLVARQPLELSLAIRILAFGVYITIAMGLSLLSIASPQSPVPDLMIASASDVIILIFGTQTDILRVLCFWKRTPPAQFESDSFTSYTDHKGEISAPTESIYSYQWRSRDL